MIESYDINDYLKDDKELQKAVIRELFKEITTQQGKIDAYKMSENEANEIITELKAYKDVNEDFKTAWEELKAENERLKRENEIITGMHNSSSNRFDKLYNTLQEIKAIAEECTTCGDCFNCKYTEHCSTDIEAQALGVCRMILKLITKAEEE